MEQKKIELVTKGNLMWITPATPEIRFALEQHATVRRTVREMQGYKVVYNVQSEPLYEYSEEDNVLLTFSGLRKRLTEVFNRKGFAVNWTAKDHRTLVPDPSRLSEEDISNLSTRDDQLAVFGMVCDFPENFIVEAATGWGKSFVIKQLCKILPGYRIAIVAPGTDLAKDLFFGLKKHIRDVGLVGAGGAHIDRITVSTIESMRKLKGVDWDLLLCDEVHKAGAPATRKVLAGTFHRAKCIGFSASPEGRSDNSDIAVEALFGKVEYKINYQESVDRGAVVPIIVKLHKNDCGVPVGASSSLTVNREGVWRNWVRNQLIADIANSIDRDEQVLIMVSVAEHAIYLRELLPHFEVVFSTISNKKILSMIYQGKVAPIKGLHGNKLMDGRRGALKSAFEKGELKHAIATGIWNTGVNFRQLSHLIRADALASDIASTQTPGRLSRLHDGKEAGILHDFTDEFDPTLAKRAAQRIKLYKKKGWQIVYEGT